MATKNSESLVLLGKQSGWTLIPGDTPLTRLNYFDGKFLRAADLKAEQDYLRNLVQLSNAADGPGVAHGFDLTLGDGGATLNVASGLAIDPTGRVLLLTGSTTVSIQQLIEQSRNKDLDSTSGAKAAAGANMFGDCEVASDAPPTTFQQPADLYLITISFAEGYCGEEDVYGKLCEEACATSTDRPFVVEGLVLRATPLQLGTPLAKSNAVTLTQKHRRSLVASAYFNDERQAIASLISGIGIKSDVWCFGAQSVVGAGVPLGVLARAGTATLFLDVWTARRERIDTSAKRYWQWRMRMRPWDVFLAQILQFQCQLRGVFQNTPVPGVPDPCDDAHKLVAEASEMLAEITKYYEEVSKRLAQMSSYLSGGVFIKGGVEGLSAFQQKLQAAKEAHLLMPTNRLLINGGIVELPSAGYLPVAPGEAISINEQVRRMMGEGVDLRFCIVRADYVAHALEEAQHMERISLIEGLDDAKKIPQVDILVPDGELVEQRQEVAPQFGFEANADFTTAFTRSSGETQQPLNLELPPVHFSGAARPERLPSGGGAVYLSCASKSPFVPVFRVGADINAWPKVQQNTVGDQPLLGMWMNFKCEQNLLALKVGDKANVSGFVVVAGPTPQGYLNQFGGQGANQSSEIEFRCDLSGVLNVHSVSGGNLPVLDGPIQLTSSADIPEVPGDIPFSGTTEFNAHIQLKTQSRIQIELVHSILQIVLEADWTNLAATVATLAVNINLSERQHFNIALKTSLKENADVFSLSNTNHGLAIQSLQIVGAALKDSSFATVNGNLLFPPAQPKPPKDFLVRGTQDWVLFHRRRNKQCGLETLALPSRRYRVYRIVLPRTSQNLDDVEPKTVPTKEEILKISAEDLKQFLPVGYVAFGGGVATFSGDISALKTAWNSIPGTIFWGAIGSRGDAVNDGDSLAQSRLRALQLSLGSVSPKARADVLPIIPPPLDTPDIDGIIILLSGVSGTTYYTYSNPGRGIGVANFNK
jgi:hypothetical protein